MLDSDQVWNEEQLFPGLFGCRIIFFIALDSVPLYWFGTVAAVRRFLILVK